jgi:TorA maturation chaperone TorD
MDKQTRVYIYAFLSTIFSDSLTKKLVEDIKNNEELLSMIGEESLEYFKNNSVDTITEELDTDFSSIFLMHHQPIESSVLDSKDEVLVGLQNPVMQFYFQHGYELNMTGTHIQTPDHISIELSFMQSLIMKDDEKTQREFLQKHLVSWVPPYMIACKDMASSVFFRELFDFSIEFLVADYEQLSEKLK